MTIQQKLHEVTTGPIIGSNKIYSAPQQRPDILVPFREIALHPSANEPPLRLYDTSGPYTEDAAKIDLTAGLPKPRAGWIAARGYAAAAGREVKPEDNGFTPVDRLVPLCPAPHRIHVARDSQTVTQYEFARAGIVTEEMIYVAHRENLGRYAAHEQAAAAARSRRRKNASGEKKNWVMARSAPASILALRLSRSAWMLRDSGWHSG